LIKKKIILTFDYEMYLGRDSGTIENCIINPTNKIIKILKNNNFHGLFFVDATFLTILKRDYYSGYVKVKRQILEILKSGSDVGLHIHPHWMDSYVKDVGRWSFSSYQKFRIHDVDNESASKLITDSFNILNSLCQGYSKEYKIDAFRAGGWCVQPFEYIKDDLQKIGIKYDFSVLPNQKKYNSNGHKYDYREYPKEKLFWRFDNDVIVENKSGYFIEIPMTMVSINLFDILKLKMAIKKFKVVGDGKGINSDKIDFINRIKKIRPFVARPLSSDFSILSIYKKNIMNIPYKDNGFIVYVAHPKNFTEESYKCLSYTCDKYNSYSYREIN
jgi:hypothetical protein